MWSGNEEKSIGNSFGKNNEGTGEQGNRQSQELGPTATGEVDRCLIGWWHFKNHQSVMYHIAR